MSTTPRIVTYRDAIENLQRYIGGNAIASVQEDLRAAVQSAYLELVQDRQWKYLTSIERLLFVAPQSTGTVAYDHTGGTSERLLTLSGATWPSWAPFAELWIDDRVYRIAEYVSPSQVTLEEAFNPGEDLASGTSYQLVRTTYTLPSWFMAGDDLSFANNFWSPMYVTPGDWLNLRQQQFSTGTPTQYTIMGLPELLGQMAISIWPVPDESIYADFLVRRRGRPLRLDGFQDRLNSGRVSSTLGSLTVTGEATTFAADMIGAVIRFGATGKLPTSEFGLNPYVDQRVIADYVASDEITLDAGAANTLAGVGYVISDPVDIHPDMVSAFLRGCELQLCYTRESRRVPIAREAYADALNLARSSDRRQLNAGVPNLLYNGRLADMIPVRVANQE